MIFFVFKKCSICLEEGGAFMCTQCAGVFHTECLFEWFKQSRTCPLCRFSYVCKHVFEFESYEYICVKCGLVDS